MAKNKKKTKLPTTGIVLRTTRSGYHYACYFDEKNDFPSLQQAILSTCSELLTEDMGLIPHIFSTKELVDIIKQYVDKHDCGSFEILEQYL